MSFQPNKTYYPRAKTGHRYNVADRTIARWAADPELGFPKPIIINGRWFFALDDLEAWERSRATASNSKKAA